MPRLIVAYGSPVYGGVYSVMVFAKPGLFATKIGSGLIPLGFYLAIGMITFVVAVTGLYARLGARLFGQMTDVVVRELGL